MIIGALWVLEQEQKVYQRHFGSPSTHESELMAGALMAAGLQTSLIGGTPYRSLIRWVGHEDALLRKLALHSPRSLGGKGIPLAFEFGKGMIGFRPKWMTLGLGRKFAAKAASRFIPYVGWALFATDVYFSAKWVKENWI